MGVNTQDVQPITGTALICIGAPHWERVSMPWCGSTLTITAPDCLAKPYIVGARLNGRALDRALLRLDELAGGGKLELRMGATPGDWGRDSQVQLRPVARRMG